MTAPWVFAEETPCAGPHPFVEVAGAIYGDVNRQTTAMKVWQCPPAMLFGFRNGAARWNERIRIDPEKLPPRASKNEPHCRWRIKLAEERVDYAAEPGDYVREHGLQRETDAEIVNHGAGKYSRKRR